MPWMRSCASMWRRLPRHRFARSRPSKAIAGLNRSVDEHKSKAIDLMRQISRLHNDINGLKINQENLTNQKGRSGARKSADRRPNCRS